MAISWEAPEFANMVDGEIGHDNYTYCFQLWS